MFVCSSRGLRCGGLALLAGWLTIASLPRIAAQQAGETAAKASSRKAIAFYSDAAGYQNKGAYSLAVEEWKKLLDEFPDDPLASKAWHYLGICYTQLAEPDYARATAAFQAALEDPELEVREESLINLSWCLFSQARSAAPDSPEQRQGLEEARQRLTAFLQSYGEGNYTDQALFYLGEIEYTLGNVQRSIPYYKRLLDTESMKKSSLRPGALYALSVAYEEDEQLPAAIRSYQQLLKEFPKHTLVDEVSVRLADLWIKQGKTEEARQVLQQLVAKDGGNLKDYALLRLGYAAASQGDQQAASEHYAALLAEYTDSQHAPAAALSLGQALYQAGQYSQAVANFQRALPAQDDQAADAAHWLAITYLKMDQPQRALDALQEPLVWAKASPRAVDLRMDYADALYAMPEKLDAARLAYEKIVEEHPDHALAPRAAYNAAFAALQGRKLSDARRWSELFLNRYPQDPLRNDVAAVAAEALLQQGEHAAAAAAYAKLRQADPQNPALNQWTLRQATAHYLDGDYPAAIDVLSAAVDKLEQADQRAEAQFVLGASYLYQEQTSQAIEHLTASHQTSDSWSAADEVLLVLADAYQRNQQNDKARQSLERLLEKYPETRLKAQVEYKLAQLSANAGQLEQAISRYQSIVNNPDAASYHNFARYGMVWCLMQQEDYPAALQQLQPLLEQQLSDSIGQEAKLAQGVCLRQTGQTPEAIVALQEFLAGKPSGTSLANGLYELGLAFTQQGELPQAIEQLQRIVQEVPGYPAMDKVLYELAWNYHESGQSTAAQQAFQQLAEQHPESEYQPEALYMLAQQHYQDQDYPRAAETYAAVMSGTQDAQLLEKTQYKLGWSYFQQQQYDKASAQFAAQAKNYPRGPLAVDARFMLAECAFQQQNYQPALTAYQQARQLLETASDTAASEQVQSLIYLHGAQCHRELEQWADCEQWLQVVIRDFPESPYLWTAIYELGYAKQQQEQPTEALKFYGQVVDNNRNELGARARFMMGEVYFSQRDFQRAIEEFTRVAYGFGGDNAPPEIKNWQAKSAYEAARCYEVLAPDLRGESRDKAMAGARKFYEDIVRDHAQHELAQQASTRLGELRKLR